jgi:hypothetical protein
MIIAPAKAATTEALRLRLARRVAPASAPMVAAVTI